MDTSRIVAVFVGVLLLSSACAGNVGGEVETAGIPFGETVGGIDPSEEADAVYVSDDGEAILTYERTHETPRVEGTVSVEPETGLAYAQYDGDFEAEPGVVGDATFRTDDGTAASSGDLLIADTGSIAELDADVDVEKTGTESSSEIDLEGAFTDIDTAYESFRSEGDLEFASGTLVASGSTRTVDANESALRPRTKSLEVSVVGTDDGYAMNVSERRVVESWETNRWDSRLDAEETLETRFLGAAIEMRGVANGSLESYKYAELAERDVVEYEYDVEYTGVEERVAERLVTEVQSFADVELEGVEARAMADRVAASEFDEGSIALERDGARTDIDWEFELGASDELVLGAVEISESIDRLDDDLANQFDDVRAALETRSDSDLRQAASWNVSTDQRGSLTTIDAEWHSDAENWTAYTQELERNGLAGFVPNRTTSATLETTGDGIAVVYDYETAADDPFERTILELEDAAADADDVVAATGELNELFESAELSQTNLTIDEEGYELEGAAAASESFEGNPLEESHGLALTELHVETAGDSSTVSLVTSAFVGDDPSESAVREREQIGPETKVYMPGEWERDLPEIDQKRVEAFLGTELEESDDDGATAGPLVAVIVIAGLGLVAVYGGYRTIGRRTESDRTETTREE
ncbi:hypothetical protein EL22_19085 [Halostagnicola sp. A56]|uniref:hypothetical protein n=1 Tax=Halostagnicola sp. A56 TaxID=1495067 RepID=UPI00049FC13E|nr:hypothetical protein [Halostagnicola sp. A56]KDE59693.1 hypothetical protein EL22_19085 [Halostagnicola sp. A56]